MGFSIINQPAIGVPLFQETHKLTVRNVTNKKDSETQTPSDLYGACFSGNYGRRVFYSGKHDK